MMKGYVCLLVVLFFYSCGIMNDKHTTKNWSELTDETRLDLAMKIDQELQDNSIKMIVRDDSLNKDWNIQLWPKGKFTFSLQNGFEGEADKVLINGRSFQRNRSTETEATDKTQRNSANVSLHEKKKNVDTSKQEEKSIKPNSSWLLTCGFLLVIFVLLIYLRKLFISK